MISTPKLDGKGIEIKGSGYTKTLCYSYDGALFDGIPKDADIVETIKKGTFIVGDNYTAEAVEQLFRDDPVKAHALKKDTATFKNWKESLRFQKGTSDFIRFPQISKPMKSELSCQPTTIDNSIIYNNKLRFQESSNNGVGGISACVLEGEIDEDTHTELWGVYYEKNAGFVKSEPAASVHVLKSDEIRDPVLKSEPAASVHVLKSEESLSVDGNIHLTPLLIQALTKLAKNEYHSTVFDLDIFVRNFNSRTPEFKKTLGSFVVENEARKLKITGWK